MGRGGDNGKLPTTRAVGAAARALAAPSAAMGAMHETRRADELLMACLRHAPQQPQPQQQRRCQYHNTSGNGVSQPQSHSDTAA